MSLPQASSPEIERRAFVVTGVVQGVGFRPFVHRLAHELGLSGFVRNRAGEVQVEAEGAPHALEAFAVALTQRAPPLANVAAVRFAPLTAHGQTEFTILGSEDSPAPAPFFAPDMATCERCLQELFEPRDRRFRYPFINCTDCGPRFTIIESAPYDRERTTMRGFALCGACRAEYEDPRDRRFHAEPNACPACGPRLVLLDASGQPLPEPEPLLGAAAALRAEQIVAVKGVGGFHLACLASSERAVAELRRRKGRDQQPFALLVRTLAAAAELCELTPEERALLQSPERPIVLAPRKPSAAVAEAVAFQSPLLGLMLAYTPLHHLLCRALDDAPLVMTSGNPSHEPIVYEDADARRRLAPLSDRTLTHDRPIHLRCDDSVVRISHGAPCTLRRARGAAPRPTPLGVVLRRPILALGAQSNASFALGRNDQALVSHHLGDLANAAAELDFRRAVAHYERLFAVQPELLVHDLHPDYATTAFARELAAERGISRLAVQHHHAHVVSCMVEHTLAGPLLGLAWDGTGLGTDGRIWGGEFFVCDRRSVRRVAHLRELGLPGGERAIREPWRVALAALLDAGLGPEALGEHLDRTALRVACRMLERGLNCPHASSAGRLFDAVSSLCGVRHVSSYDGQAAIELEWLASRAPAVDDSRAYPYELAQGENGAHVLDTRPLIVALASELRRGVAPARVARRFHATLAALILDVCLVLRAEHGLTRVVLSGGVFANALLVTGVEKRLRAAQFQVFRPQRFPPGDGGLCLGQLGIAAAHEAGAS